jgi:hypothetical protein
VNSVALARRVAPLRRVARDLVDMASSFGLD